MVKLRPFSARTRLERLGSLDQPGRVSLRTKLPPPKRLPVKKRKLGVAQRIVVSKFDLGPPRRVTVPVGKTTAWDVNPFLAFVPRTPPIETVSKTPFSVSVDEFKTPTIQTHIPNVPLLSAVGFNPVTPVSHFIPAYGLSPGPLENVTPSPAGTLVHSPPPVGVSSFFFQRAAE